MSDFPTCRCGLCYYNAKDWQPGAWFMEAARLACPVNFCPNCGQLLITGALDEGVPTPVSILIPGHSVPELKRGVPRGEHWARVDMPRALEFKAKVAFFAAQVMAGHDLFDEPIEVEFVWTRLKPKSWAKKKTWPLTRPDLNNLMKIAEDALEGVVYRDDSQVCRAPLVKQFGPEEQLEVHVQVLQHDWPYRKGGE